MRYKKVLAAASVAAAVMGLLAGCGGSNDSSNGKETIQFFSTKAENSTTLKELISKFEKANPTITVELISPGNNAGTVLKTDLTKNTLPDVFAMGGDATFLTMVQAGVLEDLTDKPFMSSLGDTYVKEVTSMYNQEAIYGAPYAVNASGIIYNKDLFTKAGITAPTTWDEFTKDTATLKAANITPLEVGFQGADNWTTMCIWNSIAPSIQPANFGQDRQQNKTTFTKDMKPVVQKFLDVLKYVQPNFMGTSYNASVTDFANGKTAMLIQGSWVIPMIYQANPKANFGIIPFPTTNDASKNYLTSGLDVLLAVNKSSAHKAAAEKFVSFMMQSDSATTYSNEQYAYSAVNGVTLTDPAMVEAAKVIADGHVADFPDHLYPGSFSMANVLSQTCLDYTKGMSDSANVDKTVKADDSAYNTANVTN
jgi:raffinose/stachyose/melibiose transport system substrate-binding protein